MGISEQIIFPEIDYDKIDKLRGLDIVITKQNRKPVIDSIQVIVANGPYLTLTEINVNDSLTGNNDHNADYSETVSFDLTTRNLGVETAYNVAASFTSADTNIIIAQGTFVFDSIPAGSTVVGKQAFLVNVRNNVPDLHEVSGTVGFSDGNSNWNAQVEIPLHAPQLAIGTVTVLDPAPGGNNNGVLDPGESATLQILTGNTGHAPVANGIGHLTVLSGSSPYIIVLNPDAYIGNLPEGVNTPVSFNVITNGIAPVGTQVSLDYHVTAGTANQYSLNGQVDLELGQMAVYNMGTTASASTCNAYFYDAGGPSGNYPNNVTQTMTFYPAASGAMVQADFTFFHVETSASCNYDYLKIYNGESTIFPLLGTYCGTTSPGTVTSTSGPLTFVFHSDYDGNYPGWEATIHCAGGPLTMMANAFPSQVCTGSTTQLTAVVGGGSGTYTYLWEPSTYLDDPTSPAPIATPLADITYTVTVNDGTNAITSSPVVVTVVAPPDPASVTQNADVLESSVLNGNQWYLNGGQIAGATGQTYVPEVSGTYYTVVTDPASGCQSAPSNAIAFYMTGIPVTDNGNLGVWPNPFTSMLNIHLDLPSSGSVEITLTDAFGKQIRVVADETNVPAGPYQATLSGSSLKAGMYYLQVRTDQFTTVRKVILTK
jgi:hypothetical protein